MKRTSLLALTIFMIFVIPVVLTTMADAQSAPGKAPTYTVYGFGTSSCNTWRQDKSRNDRAYAADKAWATGYVSGAGYAVSLGSDGQRKLKTTDSAGIVAFIDTYCQGHPLEAISEAAQALIQDLSR